MRLWCGPVFVKLLTKCFQPFFFFSWIGLKFAVVSSESGFSIRGINSLGLLKQCDYWTLDSVVDVQLCLWCQWQLSNVPSCNRVSSLVQTVFYVRVGLHHIWSGGLSGDWAHSSHSFLCWSCLCLRSDFIPHPKVMLFVRTCTGGRGGVVWRGEGVFFSSVQHDDVRLGEMEM